MTILRGISEGFFQCIKGCFQRCNCFDDVATPTGIETGGDVHERPNEGGVGDHDNQSKVIGKPAIADLPCARIFPGGSAEPPRVL